MNRQAYPSDVSDAEWDFVAPYLSVAQQLVQSECSKLTAASRRILKVNKSKMNDLISEA